MSGGRWRTLLRAVVVCAAVGLVVGAVAPGVASAREAGSGSPRVVAGVPLRDAVVALPVAEESREGYSRDKFKHWVDADGNGCSTRAEVLLVEAVDAPVRTGRCTLAGGRWYSSYDDVYVDGPSGLDIDHMVPLAEAWDSGAHEWTPQRRENYANDLDEPLALIAVTATTNRSKGDQDPQSWLPPYAPAHCGYLLAWVTTKVRWGLSVDQAERDRLVDLAAGCPNVPVTATIV